MNSARIQNLPSNSAIVKGLLKKCGYYRAIFRPTALKRALQVAVLAVWLGIPSAQAEDTNTLAMINATHLTNLLHGVASSRAMAMVEQIAKNKVQRPAPNQPVWILDTSSGVILYYQGQPSFTNQPAAQLVDDQGIRFGQQALDNARNAKSGWLTITLGGTAYRAYCLTREPTVVCSLAVK